jgi:hypothetical protein
MRKYSKWSLIVVGAGMSLFALPVGVVRADGPAAVQPGQGLAFPAGFQSITGAPDSGVYSGLAKYVERAVTKGDFDKMLEELSKPDRERARAFKGVDQGKLDVQIARIHDAWKAKYGKEFSIDDKIVFGSPLLIIPGEVTTPGVALTNWPVPATQELAVLASAKHHEVPAGEVKKDMKDNKLEKGRHVTLVRFPAMNGKSELTISMIHHLPAFWRIDIPNDRTGEEIYNDTLTHLTMIADHADQWPADVNEAARVVSYHVLAALYGANIMPAAVKG